MKITVKESFRIPGTDTIIEKGQTIVVKEEGIGWDQALKALADFSVRVVTLDYPRGDHEELNYVKTDSNKIYFRSLGGFENILDKSNVRDIHTSHNFYGSDNKTITLLTKDNHSYEIQFQ